MNVRSWGGVVELSFVRADELRDQFRDVGVVRLDGGSARNRPAPFATPCGVTSSGAARCASPIRQPGPPAAPISFKYLKGKLVFAPMIDNPSVLYALDAIFGCGGWQPPKKPGAQILLTYPTPGPWVLPTGWHMDCGFERPTWPVFAVKLFSFFDDVEAQGGGTLVLEGSHRLVERYARTLPPETGGNKDTWARFMKQDPWLHRLYRGGTASDPGRHLLGTRHHIDGIALRAIELTGSPGDVIITHLHVFHSGAPTVGSRPRQMLGGGIGAAQQHP